MLKKYFYFSLMTLSLLVIAKPTEKTKAKPGICKQYPGGTYISYTGDIFLVTQDCKRKILTKTESQNITKQGYPVKQVGADVIRAIPREVSKSIFTFEEMQKKYKSHCVSAGKITYLVTPQGKKAYFSREIAKTSCPNGIDQIPYPELRALPDIAPFAPPKNLYPPIKKGDVPKKISTKTACAKLNNNFLATFHSKIYKIKKDKNECYLVELRSQNHEVRMQLGEITPTELTPSQFVSLKKEKEKSKENPNKLYEKGQK